MEALFREFEAVAGAAESLRDRDLDAADELYSRLLPVQKAVIEDKSRAKSARCPRRSGKTFMVLYYAMVTCLRNRCSRVVIITLTQKSGKRNYWRLLHDINTEFGLDIHFHDSNLEMTFPNGSYLFLSGAETMQEVEKLRGDQYDLAVIDECKSFSDRILLELLDAALGPALSDRGGTCVMIGTPGTICSGIFYNATTGGSRNDEGVLISWSYNRRDEIDEIYEWSTHHWTQEDNTALPNIWEDSLRKKALKGWTDDNPTWRREHLGEWTAGESALVFCYSEKLGAGKVTWTPSAKASDNPFGLPEGHTWEYVLGADLGFEDDTALVILAYAPDLREAYAVWDFKSPHLTATPLANIIRQAERMVGGRFAAMVADTGGGGSKMMVETLNVEHACYFDAAVKLEKFDHIELCNSDFFDGLIKLDPRSDLAREIEVLQWDLSAGSKHELARKGRLKYSTQCQDHLSDAFLYAWRYLNHRFAQPVKVSAPKEGAEWEKLWNQEEMAKAVAVHTTDHDWLHETLKPKMALRRLYERTPYRR